MTKIIITPPDLSDNEKTYLSTAYSSGTILVVQNNNGLSANDFLVAGKPGIEKTELGTISSVSGGATINLSTALTFSHVKDTPVYLTDYNNYELERDGSVIVSGTAVASRIQWDNPKGIIYNDTTGASTSTYRFRFYDTISVIYSSWSDYISAGGYDRAQVGFMVENVRKRVADETGDSVKDTQIIRYLSDGQNEISQRNSRWWFLRGTQTTAAASADFSYPLPDDFERADHLMYKLRDGSSSLDYRLKYIPESRFDKYIIDQSRSVDPSVLLFTLRPGDSTSERGYFDVYPTPDATTHTFVLHYYKEMAELNSFGDTTPVARPKILEDYAISQVYADRGEETQADRYMNKFEDGVKKLRLLNKRQIGQPQSFMFKGRRYEERHYGNSKEGQSEASLADYW